MFKTSDLLEQQSIDLKDVIIEANPQQTPFSTFAMSKAVKAGNPIVNWIEETIEDSATTIAEGGDAPAFVKDTSEPMSNYLELFASTATVSHTAQASEIAGINDLLLREVEKKTKSMKRYIEQKLLYGEKAFANDKYETSGIFEQINASNRHKVPSLSAIGESSFQDLLSSVYDAGVGYNLIAFMNAHTKNQLNKLASVTYIGTDKQLGFNADRFTTAYGEAYFVDVPNMKAGDIVVVNTDFIETPTLIPFQAIPQAQSGSKTSVFLQTQLGIKLLNSRAAASLRVE